MTRITLGRFFFARWFIVTLLVLLISHWGYADNHLEPGDTTRASQLNLTALELAKERNFDEAIKTFKTAGIEYKNAGAWDRFFYAQHTIGYLLNTQYKYAETYHYLDSIDAAYSSHLKYNFESYQRFYGTLAWSQFSIFNYNKAFYYFNLVDLGARENPQVKPEQILFSKYYQGVIYQRIGQYDKALKLMLLTFKLGDKYSIKTYLGMSYNNLGIIYRNLGEYERALEFYKKALVEEKKSKPEVNLTPLYNNLGMIYFYLKDYAAAKKELNYGINILRDYTSDYYPVESALINSKALVLIELDSLDQARVLLEKTLARELEKYKEYGAYSVSTLQDLGRVYSKSKEYEKANEYFKQSIDITIKYLGKSTDKLADIYNNIGNNLLKTKNYREALENVQKGIVSLVTDFNTLDFKTNPIPNSTILDKVELIKSQYLKAEILLHQYQETNDIKYLKGAEASNRVAMKLVDIVRENMLYESSKMNLSKRAKSIYEQTIEIALLLEKEINQPATTRIFEAMEGSKAYLLTENREKAKALGYSNLPQTILTKEDSFRTEMKVLATTRSNLMRRSKDSTQLAKLNQHLFAIKEEFEKYKQTTAGKSSIYQHKIFDLEKYQENLADGDLIIEYFAGKNDLYALALSRTSTKVYQLGAYTKPTNTFVNSIRNVQSMEASEYQSLASDVYTILLAPILAEHNLVKRLVIIPDKQIGYIPFDALVSAEIKAPQYNTLKYLLNKYTLLQHQTAALYLDQNNRREDQLDNFIGFAPDFNDPEQILASNKQFRSNLQPLTYAKKEVTSISELLDGEEETGVEASESSLKAKASSFNILHLATHAIIDEDNPIYSKLLFNSSDSSTNDDGALHSYEIYGMKLNASLVTLSACNTGTGKYLEGEGIFSLGRSFLMAGANSVLTSLWEVSDLSTSQIMEAFYTNIKTGKTNPEALRKAKLEYLKNSDPLTANPHYWAAFVYIGRPEAIYASNIIYFWLGAIGLLLIGGFMTAKKLTPKKHSR